MDPALSKAVIHELQLHNTRLHTALLDPPVCCLTENNEIFDTQQKDIPMMAALPTAKDIDVIFTDVDGTLSVYPL